jgi:hypothetical protein
MSDAPQVLLAHHLKALKLPTCQTARNLDPRSACNLDPSIA